MPEFRRSSHFRRWARAWDGDWAPMAMSASRQRAPLRSHPARSTRISRCPFRQHTSLLTAFTATPRGVRRRPPRYARSSTNRGHWTPLVRPTISLLTAGETDQRALNEYWSGAGSDRCRTRAPGDHDCWRLAEPADAYSPRAQTGCSAMGCAAVHGQQSEKGLNNLPARNPAPWIVPKRRAQFGMFGTGRTVRPIGGANVAETDSILRTGHAPFVSRGMHQSLRSVGRHRVRLDDLHRFGG